MFTYAMSYMRVEGRVHPVWGAENLVGGPAHFRGDPVQSVWCPVHLVRGPVNLVGDPVHVVGVQWILWEVRFIQHGVQCFL